MDVGARVGHVEVGALETGEDVRGKSGGGGTGGGTGGYDGGQVVTTVGGLTGNPVEAFGLGASVCSRSTRGKLIGESDTGMLLLGGGVTGTALTIGGSDTGGIVTPPPIIVV